MFVMSLSKLCNSQPYAWVMHKSRSKVLFQWSALYIVIKASGCGHYLLVTVVLCNGLENIYIERLKGDMLRAFRVLIIILSDQPYNMYMQISVLQVQRCRMYGSLFFRSIWGKPSVVHIIIWVICYTDYNKIEYTIKHLTGTTNTSFNVISPLNFYYKRFHLYLR